MSEKKGVLLQDGITELWVTKVIDEQIQGQTGEIVVVINSEEKIVKDQSMILSKDQVIELRDYLNTIL